MTTSFNLVNYILKEKRYEKHYFYRRGYRYYYPS